MKHSLLFCLMIMGLLVVSIPTLGQDSGEATAVPNIEEAILFDDFNYAAYDDPQLSENGWIIRTVEGWPGVPGAIWRDENVSFLEDPDEADNWLMQFTSSTDGDAVYQTQICHQRKYYEGTYATRVRFTDTPESAVAADQVVQTFYLISPQEYDLDPDYSEHDYEYLPNGGWGAPPQTFFMTSWETFQLDPWIADNESDSIQDSFDGWHTLVIQIMDDEVNYYIDGELVARHGEGYYPEVPMSINYNLWFINGGLDSASGEREYTEQMDWVFHIQGVALTPDEVQEWVARLREEGTAFVDTVPELDPPLESPCNF